MKHTWLHKLINTDPGQPSAFFGVLILLHLGLPRAKFAWPILTIILDQCMVGPQGSQMSNALHATLDLASFGLWNLWNENLSAMLSWLQCKIVGDRLRRVASLSCLATPRSHPFFEFVGDTAWDGLFDYCDSSISPQVVRISWIQHLLLTVAGNRTHKSKWANNIQATAKRIRSFLRIVFFNFGMSLVEFPHPWICMKYLCFYSSSSNTLLVLLML